MFRLRTLGPPALVDSEGGSVSGAAAQRKPLALLVLLTVAGDAGMTRERLASLLWPELDEMRSRQALRQTLYALRRDTKAPELFLERTALHLNPAILCSDVGEFLAAYRSRDFQTAVRVYGGPFLDGFYVAESDEFERWAEAERTELAGRRSLALERLAVGAIEARDLEGAVGWWRRLLATSPCDGRVVGGLMRALVESGSPESALACAREYETRIRAEYDTRPDSGVTRLVREIRVSLNQPEIPWEPHVSESSPAELTMSPPRRPMPNGGSVRPATIRARALTASFLGLMALTTIGGVFSLGGTGGPEVSEQALPLARSIAVLPFEDQSALAKDRYYGAALAGEVARRLGQVRSLRVIGPAATAAYQDSSPRLHSLSRALGVGAVLEGKVRVHGDRVDLALQLRDVSTETAVWTLQSQRALPLEPGSTLPRHFTGTREYPKTASSNSSPVAGAPCPVDNPLDLASISPTSPTTRPGETMALRLT